MLKVISRSTFDLKTVLNTLVKSAAHLCEADMAALARPKGSIYGYEAMFGHSREHEAFLSAHPAGIDRGTAVGRTLVQGKIVHIPDVLTDPEYTYFEGQRLGGFRTLLGVPLLREGTPIGVLVVQRKTVRPFTEKQIELVTTFADQAVIAIENVRLFDEVQARTRELSEALEQQTATSEVLQVISNSLGDLQPVFEAMLANATRLCGAEFGILNLDDGDVLRIAALYNVPPALGAIQNVAFQVHPKSGQAEIRRTKQVVHIDDIRAMPPILKAIRGSWLSPTSAARARPSPYRCSRRVRCSARSRSIARRCGHSPTSRSSWSTNFAASGRNRHREHPPAQRAAGIAAAADRHRRRAQGHQSHDVRSADGAGYAGRVGRAAVRGGYGSYRSPLRVRVSSLPRTIDCPRSSSSL